MDASLIARLILAHLLGDFVFQPNHWVSHRNLFHFKSKYLYLHAALQGGMAWLATLHLEYWWVGLGIGLGHLVFDGTKAFFKKQNLIWFLVDQLLHMVVIIVMVGWSTRGRMLDMVRKLLVQPQVCSVLAVYLMVITLYSKLIALATQPWRTQIPEDREPLIAAGRWIGIIERVLILTFILINQFSAIGFLLAAKSVFRFGDLRESRDKSHTEYVMIGTLLSFSITIITGLALKLLLAKLL